MMQIDLSTAAAQKAVDDLGNKIEGLGEKARIAGKRSGEGLDFAKAAKAQFASLRKEFSSMSGVLGSLQKEFRAVNSVAAANTGIAQGMAQISRMVSKAMTGTTQAIRSQTKELKSLAGSTTTTATAQRKATSEAQRYLAALIKQNQAMAKSDIELATHRSGWDALGKTANSSQKLQTLHQIRLQHAFKDTSSLMKQQLTTMQQYQKQAAHLAMLRDEKRNNPKAMIGISERQYTDALRNLDTWLKKTTESEKKKEQGEIRAAQSSLRAAAAAKGLTKDLAKQKSVLDQLNATIKGSGGGAGGGMSRLNSEFHIGAQAAAGFRAAMHGANLGFGIFTSSTLVTATAVYGLTKGLVESISVGAQFQRSFQRTAVMMKSFEEIAAGGANAMTGQTKAVRDLVLDLAETTQYTAVEVADAASVLALSGQESFEIYSNLSSVLDLASVGMMDMSKAADIATGMMASFGMSGKDFERSVDIIAATAAKTKASVEDIGMSMTYIGPIAHQAGTSIEQVSAAMGILAENNIRGSKSGTALRRMFTNLLSPTAAGRKAFEGLGLDLAALTEGGVDLVKVFQALSDAGADIGDLKNIFGQYALTSAAALQANVANFRTLNTQMETQVQGFAARTRDALTQNFQLAVEELKNVIQRGMIAAFDQFGPGLEKDIRELAETLRGETGTIAEAISAVAGAVIRAAKQIIGSIGMIKQTMGPIFTGLNMVLQLTADHFGKLAVILLGYSAFKVVSSTLGLVTRGLEGAGAAATAYGLRQQGANIAARDYGSIFAPAYIKAVNTKAAALKQLPIQMNAVQKAQIALTAATTVYTRLPAVSPVMATGFARVATTAATAAPAVGLLARAAAGFAGVARGLLAVLGGLPGLLITAATIAIPMMAGAMGDAATQVQSLTGAVETFEAFEGRIGEMSDRVRVKLTQDLKKDIDTAKANIAALKQELKDAPERAANATAQADMFDSLFGWSPTGYLASVVMEMRAHDLNVEAINAEKVAKQALIEQTDELKAAREADAAMAEVNANNLTAAQQEVSNAFKLSNEAAVDSISVFGQFADPIIEVTQELKNLRTELANFIEMALGFVLDSPLSHLIPQSAIDGLQQFVMLLRTASDIRVSDGALGAVGGGGKDGLGFPGVDFSPGFMRPNQEVNGVRDAAEDIEEDAKGAAKALKEATAELSKYFSEYEKGTGSVAGMKRELAEISKAQADIAAGTPAATAALKEQGYTAKEAQAALIWKKEDLAFDYISQKLGEMDPRFKDLKDSLNETKTGMLTAGSAVDQARGFLQGLGLTATEVTDMMAKLEPALRSVGDGTAKLAKDYQKLSEEAGVLMAKWAAPSTFDAMVDKFRVVGRESTELTMAVHRASEMFGDFKGTVSETQQVDEANKILNILVANVKETGITAEIAAEAMRDFYKSTPLGALEEENRQIQIRTGLMFETAETQHVINAAVAQYGSDLSKMPAAFLEAAAANYRLNEEMKRIEEVQSAFKTFGDSAARTFAGLFDGSTKGFGDMVDKFKDMFKQLLAELAYLAIKNTIVVNFAGGGSSGTGGWAQMLGGLLGGGGGGSNSTGAATTGAQLMMQGMGLGAGSGGASGTGAIMNMLTGLGALNGGGGGTDSSGSAGGTNASWTNYLTSGASFYRTGSQFFGGGGSMTSAIGRMWYGNAYGAGNASAMQSYGVLNTSNGLATSGGMPAWGTAASWAGGIAGGAYGFTQRGSSNGSGGSIAAGLSYGALGMGLAGTAAGMAGGLGVGAAAGGSFAALGGAAWIPVVGWILAAAAVIDMISGGKLFGTRYRPESAEQTLRLNAQGGDAQATVRDVRNRSLFQGRQWRTREVDAGDEAERAADKFFRDVQRVMRDGANDLRIETPPMIDAALRVVTEYDKKGKVKATKTFVDILGRTWEETGENAEELAATRIIAESMIATLDAAFPVQRIVDAVADPFEEGWSEAEQRIGARVSDIGEIVNNALNGGASGAGGITHAGEASQIAERWRDDAEMLMEGAQFLLLAGKDIRRGLGLLGEGGSLTQVTDLIETLQRGGETLSETYQRVVASVQLVEATLGAFNVSAGRTRTEFVEFSDELVSSLGGISNATTALQTFAEAFGQIGALADVQSAMARQERTGLMSRIGVDPETTAEEFIALFTAALPELTAAEVADWVAAGQPIANVALALRDMRAQLEGGQSLADQLDSQIDAMRRMGAFPHEIAEAVAIADQIISNALRDFMGPIREEVAGFEGDEYAVRIANINRETEEAIRQATALRASEEDLNLIRRRGEYQIAAIAKELEDFMFGIEGQIAAIEGHPVQHHLKEIAREMENNIRQARSLGASEEQLSRIRQLASYQMIASITELKNSIRSLVAEFYDTGDQDESMAEQAQAQYEAQREAAQSLYDMEMQRYEDAQEAIKNIAKFLTDLEIGELSPGSWQDRLGASRTNFMDLFARAQAGDTDALSEITGAAQQFLELGSEFYGSTTGYADIYNLVTSMLRSLNVTLGEIQPPADLPPDTGGPGGSGSSESESEAERIRREAERFQMALSIAQQIGDLGLALDVSVFDLMEDFGVKLQDLAVALGININSLNADTVSQLQLLSGALGIGFLDVVNELGIQLPALATAFGINIADFSATNVAALAQFAAIIGEDIVGTAEMLNISLNSFTNALVNSINTSLTSLPDLPAEITLGLQPFLEAIRNADSSQAVRDAIGLLTGFVATLPQDQRDLLAPILEGVGISVGNVVGSSQVEVMQQVKAAVDSVREAQAGTTLGMFQIDGKIGMSNQLLSEISGGIAMLAGIMIQVRDGFEAPPPKTTTDTLIPTGSYTPTQDDSQVVAAYSAASYVQDQQEEAAAQTQALAERVEVLTEVVDKQLGALNSRTETGNTDRRSMKNTTRIAALREATKQKKGRSK